MTSYFVKIENLIKNPVEIEAWMKKERNSNGFSPLFAYEVLKKTNHYANLKFVIKEILKKPEEERFLYKSFVLSAIEGRLHSENVHEGLRKLAEEGGYLREFNRLNSRRKVYWPQSCKVAYAYYENDEGLKVANWGEFDTLCIRNKGDDEDTERDDWALYNARGAVALDKHAVLPRYCDIKNIPRVVWGGCDLSRVKDIRVGYSTGVHFESVVLNEYVLKIAKKNPNIYFYDCDFGKMRDKRLEFAKDAEVTLYNSRNLPMVIDCSHGYSFKTDLKSYDGVKEIIFGKDCGVNFREVGVLPETFRFNKCLEIELNACNFENVREFNLNGVWRLSISFARNVNCEIDFSQCKEVSLTNFEYDKKVEFAEDSEVDLYKTKLLGGADFSKCKSITLSYFDFNTLKGQKLENCKSLKVTHCVNIPEELDVSDIESVGFYGQNFRAMNKITFKDNAKVFFDVCCLPKELDLSSVGEAFFKKCDCTNIKRIIFKDRNQLKTCIKNGMEYDDVKDKIEILEKKTFDRFLDFVQGM
jgi:hypothetical protein